MLLMFMSNVVYYKKSQDWNTPWLWHLWNKTLPVRRNRRKPYRMNDSFASRFFFLFNTGKDGDMCGRWEHVKPSPCCPIFRQGVEVTPGAGKKPEYSSALTARWVTAPRHCAVRGFLETALLRMDLKIFFLMLQNGHFKNKYQKLIFGF